MKGRTLKPFLKSGARNGNLKTSRIWPGCAGESQVGRQAAARE